MAKREGITVKNQSLPAEIETKPLFKKIRHLKKRQFLAAFSQSGRITAACAEVKIHYSTHYVWLQRDKNYAQAFELAKEIAGDIWESEIYRRAFEGVEKPLFFKGRLTGDTVNERSDLLAMFALKGLRPKFRDSFVPNNIGPTHFNIVFTHQPQKSSLTIGGNEASKALVSPLTKAIPG